MRPERDDRRQAGARVIKRLSLVPRHTVAASLLALTFLLAANGADLDKLNVLYVGDAGTPRAKHFEGFLRQNVGHIEVVARGMFKPGQAEKADVVLLDWPQSEGAR